VVEAEEEEAAAVATKETTTKATIKEDEDHVNHRVLLHDYGHVRPLL
jgi:hypothetical protein